MLTNSASSPKPLSKTLRRIKARKISGEEAKAVLSVLIRIGEGYKNAMTDWVLVLNTIDGVFLKLTK